MGVEVGKRHFECNGDVSPIEPLFNNHLSWGVDSRSFEALQHESKPGSRVTLWSPLVRLGQIFVLTLILLSLPRIVFAQDVPEFRVESKQVLVPVSVLDGSGNEPSNLTEKDFHLFEDGKEQRIRIALLRLDVRDFPDNLGGGIDLYSYYSTRARWTSEGGFVTVAQHLYLLTYIPPPSPDGSCHKIEVKTSRHAWWAFATVKEYCNTHHSTYDAFNGTALDKKMEQYAAAGNTGSIFLTLGANFTYSGPNSARGDIILEFPAGLELANKNDEPDYGIQVLGFLYMKDGSVAARFSDRRECLPVTWMDQHELTLKVETVLCKSASPYRYEVQVDVAPGEYEIRAVISDGKGFGFATMPLHIEKFNGKQLAISGIALCKRFHPFSNSTSKSETGSQGLPAQEVIFPTKIIPFVSKGIEFTPAADTHFRKTDPMAAYFEVYEPLLDRLLIPKVQVHVKIVDAKSGIVSDDFQPVDIAPYIEPGNSNIHVSRKIPLDKLPAGSYRLEVQAFDSAGESTVWRAAAFSVN